MKISKSDKLVLDFLEVRCNSECDDCEFSDLCEEASTYMAQRGLWVNGPVYCEEDLEVEE